MEILYQKKGFFYDFALYVEKDMVYLKEVTIGKKVVYQLPKNQLNRSISFSRTHQPILGLVVLFFFFQSIRLLFFTHKSNDFPQQLGLFLATICIIIGFYYALYGRKYGNVELDFGGETFLFSMQPNEYDALQQNLSELSVKNRKPISCKK